VRAPVDFRRTEILPRNTPSLINVTYNHLVMLDGKHTTLLNQARAVVTNPKEMGADEKDVLEKILSCEEYNKAFRKFLKYTPRQKSISTDHIFSAIILYYSS